MWFIHIPYFVVAPIIGLVVLCFLVVLSLNDFTWVDAVWTIGIILGAVGFVRLMCKES